ncbi:hypothetical protein DCS_07604 [Drechmeria coniospora]|uniref:Carbohydrate kinase PfkB domain-containing protein n=1 Tax=Drechmeria coniospora TaxID=98403 RepID=A0A151GEZ8_DRECN|nr:hypothetical protein DCS_07604 [Drechmeria coniospora]KYK55641.1 hypothetical protein DCS_07604 [Drechmeria coniospora]ODA81754.1 hypothetical protein RJ55_00258 [Drechmeria coniospora]
MLHGWMDAASDNDGGTSSVTAASPLPGAARSCPELRRARPVACRATSSRPMGGIASESTSVPRYPDEDDKLRATSLQVRRGGNCPNSLEVLQQLLRAGRDRHHDVRPYLVTCLPDESSPATRLVMASFGDDSAVDFGHCLHRQGHAEAASSHIIRSARTGSRTIVNYNELPEMTVGEFEAVAHGFRADQDTWWHFEGRMPETTLRCIETLRKTLPSASISVEVEKPGRVGLAELAAEADVVFYSRAWAEVSDEGNARRRRVARRPTGGHHVSLTDAARTMMQSRGHQSPEACLRNEHRRQESLGLCAWGAEGAAALSRSRGSCEYIRCPVETRPGGIPVVDSIGAGDTLVAGMLYGLTSQAGSWDVERSLRFAVDLATLKVQREGFGGLAADVWPARHGNSVAEHARSKQAP